MNKIATDVGKPCNRIVTNYCFNIVQNYLGYLTGIDITYSSPNDFDAIQDVLNYNDVRTEDNEYLRNALIFGRAFEINYVDEDAIQRFKVLDSRECIPIYSNDLNNDLLYVIRYYVADTVNNDQDEYYIEVYGNDFIRKYKSSNAFATLSLLEEKPNIYNQVPITVFSLNTDEESIFDKVMTLQDAYNKLLSSEVDDFESFCDAYLVLKGCQADADDLVAMKQNRVLLMDTDAEASYLTKSVSDTQIENMLKNINDASVSGNTLTLTKKDDTEVVFTPSGGSGGDGSSYTLPVADMNTLGGIKVQLEPVKNEQINKIGTPLIYNEDVLTTAYIPKATVNYPGVVQLPSSNTGLYTNVVGDLDIKEATTTNLGTVAFDGITIKQNDNKVKQLYAATATASSLGVVKPDGTTTTVDSQGNLSMIGKPAVIKTLITGRAPDWVVDWVANPDKYIVIVNNCVVFKTEKNGADFWYYWIDNDRIEHYYITFTDTTFTTPNSSQPSYSMAATQLITDVNWQNYITAGGGSGWQYTNDLYNSDLYNAKEVAIWINTTNNNKLMGYFNFGYTEGGSSTTLGQNWQGTNFYLGENDSSPYIIYDGSCLNCVNANYVWFILYKT